MRLRGDASASVRAGGGAPAPVKNRPAHAVGLKYRTMPAPTAARAIPTYRSGLIAALGGWIAIDTNTFTIGAPPKTRGITYTGRPPNRNDQMMQAAPAAPRAPATVAVTSPRVSNPASPLCALRANTGTMTPMRK